MSKKNKKQLGKRKIIHEKKMLKQKDVSRTETRRSLRRSVIALHVFYPFLGTVGTHHMVATGAVIAFWRDSVIPSTLTAVPFGNGVGIVRVVRVVERFIGF